MKTPLRLNTILLAIERGFLVLLFSLMIVLAFSQVILRNVLSVGLIWADPLLRNAVLWLGFMGASLATQQDKHIKIDLAGRFLKRRAALAVGVVTDIFTLGVCLLLMDASRKFVLNEIDFHDTLVSIGGFDVPTWWSQVILPFGFLLISLRILAGIIRRISDFYSHASPPSGSGRTGGPA